jgi:cell division protease FtsH
VSIIPRGAAALGMTMQRPLEDRYLLTEPELKDRLAILLGGRTAEEIAFERISTGAQNDLQRATEIARAMVIEYGMSPRIGPISLSQDGGPERYLFPGAGQELSPELAAAVDDEVKRLVEEAHDRARDALERKRDLLDRLSDLLMVTEVIDGADLKAYVAGERDIPSPDDARAVQSRNGQAEKQTTGPEIVLHGQEAGVPPPPPGSI